MINFEDYDLEETTEWVMCAHCGYTSFARTDDGKLYCSERCTRAAQNKRNYERHRAERIAKASARQKAARGKNP